jgi:methyl-accepting chemotaxis protein
MTDDTNTPSQAGSKPTGLARLYSLLPNVIRKSYALKLSLAFLAVLLAVGLIGGQLYLDTNEQLGTNAEERLSANANMHADQLDIWIEDSKSSIRLVANSEAARNRDPVAMQSYFDSVVRNDQLTSGARAIHYVNQDTTEILSSSLDGRIGGNARERGDAWAKRDLTSLETGQVMVTAFQSPVVNVTQIAFVTPVPNRENRAVVYIASTKAISERLHQSSGSAFTTVVNSEGKVMIDQRDSSRIGTQYREGAGIDANAVERGLSDESGFVLTNAADASTNASLATGYAPMENVNWVVLANDQQSEVFALRSQISQGVLSLIVVSALGLGLIGGTIGRTTVTSLRTLSRRAREIEEGNLDAELESYRADEIGQLFDAFDSMRASLQRQFDEVEQAQREANEARERAADARDEAEELLAHLQKKAEDYRAVMEAAANGDLTQRMATESESEAMRRIAENFNEMMAQLEQTVAEVQSFADSVSNATERVADSTDEVRATAEGVSQSVQEITDGSLDQTEQINTATSEMNNLSATIQEIASSVTGVAETSEHAAERGIQGRENGEQAVEVMETIEDQTDRTVETIEDLDEMMQQIRDIVELIDGIADEVNILALNASIEAAHADGDGDGFAVVADEIKSLATETQEATEEVTSVIEEIEDQTSASVEEMRDTQERVDEGVDAVEETVDAIEETVTAIQSANDGVQEIDRATDEQASSTQSVVAMIDEVADISEDTAAEAESVAAAAEEQASALNQVSTSVNSVAGRSQDLRELLADFDARAEVAAESRDADAEVTEAADAAADAASAATEAASDTTADD